MPRYDAECPDHGVQEAYSVPSIARLGVVLCATCCRVARLVFKPHALPNVRVDAAGEDLARRDAPGRVADGTSKVNIGLKGVEVSLGRDAQGKEHFAYRPISNAEVGSNRNAREIAARQGLTPLESGRYRPLR